MTMSIKDHVFKHIVNLVFFCLTTYITSVYLYPLAAGLEGGASLSDTVRNMLEAHMQMHGRNAREAHAVISSLTTHELEMCQHIRMPNTGFGMNSLEGLEDVKRRVLMQIILPMRLPQLGLQQTPRLLLHGPPGTGKSSIAMAIAHELKYPVLMLSPASIESKYYGESSKLVNAAFSLVGKLQHCVIFIDEIDGLLRNRDDSDASFVYSLKTDLLAAMEGGNATLPSVVLIAATNCPDKLDTALYRRFPVVLEVGLPNQTALKRILHAELSPFQSHISDLTKGSDPGNRGRDEVEDLATRGRGSRSKGSAEEATSLAKLIDVLSTELAGSSPSDVKNVCQCIRSRMDERRVACLAFGKSNIRMEAMCADCLEEHDTKQDFKHRSESSSLDLRSMLKHAHFDTK